MNSSINLYKNKKSYYLWILIFFLIWATFFAFMYYATIKIDYVWRWFRVPQYFYFVETIETKARVDGTVASIQKGEKETVITIKADDGDTVTYKGPLETVNVSENDLVFSGDTLGSYKKGKPGILLQGLWVTLKVSMIAIVFGIILGIIAGLFRISKNPAAKWSAMIYIEIIRGSPLLVQIFIWYFVLGTLINTLLARQDFNQIPPLWFGVASLSCFAGAYVAEIVRAGIESIHKGQFEAARSLGMTYTQTMWHIILPQAMRRILPPLAGQFISLIKDSSLLGIIAIRELTKATREVVTTSLQPFELFFICAILYLVLTFSLSMFVQYLERRVDVK